MSAAPEKVRERLLRAAAALQSSAIPYAVVGGNAVAAWVSRVNESAVRNTRDVDLLLDRRDFIAAAAALEKAGFTGRRVASLGKKGAMEIFLDGKDARVGDALHIVFASEKTVESQPEPNAAVSEAEYSGDFWLISLDALVRMKLSAWRDKDRVHLRDLISVGLVDASFQSRLSSELAARLAAVLADPEG